jgi:hypothetical protein
MNIESTNLTTLDVPAGAPRWVTSEIIADTLQVWQRYYDENLTADDALAIIGNVGRLYDTLRRLSDEKVCCSCAC